MSIPTVFGNPKAQSARLGASTTGRSESKPGNSLPNTASSASISAEHVSQLGIQTSGSGAEATASEDRLSFVRTAEDALEELRTILQRIRELSVQAAGSSPSGRLELQREVSRLVREINRVHQATAEKTVSALSGVEVLAGQLAAARLPSKETNATLQHDAAERTKATAGSILDLSADALGIASLPVTTSDLAQESILAIDRALSVVSNHRTQLAILQNRLERAVRSLNVAAENVLASENPIPNLAVALATVNAARRQILEQVGVAEKAQANTHPQVVLQLTT